MMHKMMTLALALLGSMALAQVSLAYEDEYFFSHAWFNEQNILSRLNLNNLAQITRDHKDAAARCTHYERELRENLADLDRSTQSSGSLFEEIATIMSERIPSARGRDLVGHFQVCAELIKRGRTHKGRLLVDSSLAPSKASRADLSGYISDMTVLGHLSLEALYETAKSSQGQPEEVRCSILSEEIREMLGALAADLTDVDLFNRLVCVFDRQAEHLKHSGDVLKQLSSCLGPKEVSVDLNDECWS